MVLLPEIENNERPDLCAACGGACCRTRPGIEAPGRFLATEDPAAALGAALSSREWLLAEHVGVPWVNGVPPPDEDRYRLIRYRPYGVRPSRAARLAEPDDALMARLAKLAIDSGAAEVFVS